MSSEALNMRQPLSAELVRGKSSQLAQQLEVLAPIAGSMAEHAGSSLSLLGGTPVKVTVLSAKVEKLSPLTQAEAGFDINSAQTNLMCWGTFDRQFDNLICDVCLGSNGSKKDGYDSDRPPTIFEKKLRHLVFERLIQATAKAFSEILEGADLNVSSRARTSIRRSQGPLQCYNIRLLVNAFDAACECELILSFAECISLAGGQPSSFEPDTTQRVLEDTSFPLEVYLQPALVDVRRILNLVPGEVLKLNIAASAPVELRMNGKMLSHGSLIFNNNQGRIRVLEAQQQRVPSRTVNEHTKAASQNGY